MLIEFLLFSCFNKSNTLQIIHTYIPIFLVYYCWPLLLVVVTVVRSNLLITSAVLWVRSVSCYRKLMTSVTGVSSQSSHEAMKMKTFSLSLKPYFLSLMQRPDTLNLNCCVDAPPAENYQYRRFLINTNLAQFTDKVIWRIFVSKPPLTTILFTCLSWSKIGVKVWRIENNHVKTELCPHPWYSSSIYFSKIKVMIQHFCQLYQNLVQFKRVQQCKII